MRYVLKRIAYLRPTQKALILSLTLVLVGCDIDWGDQASNFVDHEIYGISRNLAQATLGDLWLSSFVASDMDAMVDIKTGEFQLAHIQMPKTDDIAHLSAAELLSRFNAADAAAASLVELRLHIDILRQRLENEPSLCGNEAFLQARGVEGIGVTGTAAAIIPGLEANKHDALISSSYQTSDGSGGSANNNGGDSEDNSGAMQALASAGEFVVSIIGASEVNEQNRKLDAAIARIPTSVVRPQDVFTLSRPICNVQFDSIKDLHAQALDVATTLSGSVEAARQNAVLTGQVIAYRLRPMEINSFLEDTGVSAALTAAQQAMIRANFDTGLTQNLSGLVNLVEQVKKASDCLDALKKAELLNDTTIAFGAELKAMQANGSSTASDPQIDQALDTVNGLARNYPALVHRVSKEHCT